MAALSSCILQTNGLGLPPAIICLLSVILPAFDAHRALPFYLGQMQTLYEIQTPDLIDFYYARASAYSCPDPVHLLVSSS
jgi:hypothetical protein